MFGQVLRVVGSIVNLFYSFLVPPLSITRVLSCQAGGIIKLPTLLIVARIMGWC